MELKETLQQIKKQLRLAMNGVVSTSMREKGVHYKINFGVDYPRIKQLAAVYGKNHQLAQALWKEEIRECKIMAGLIQPIDSFEEEIAEIWIEDIRTQEMASYCCMNLFQHLPYAPRKSFQWIADEREMIQVVGFLLAARLLSKGIQFNERAENEFLNQLFTTLQSTTSAKNAAQLALEKFVLQGEEQKKLVLQSIQCWKESTLESERILYQEVTAWVDY